MAESPSDGGVRQQAAEEWVFSIRVPHDAPVGRRPRPHTRRDGDGTAASTNDHPHDNDDNDPDNDPDNHLYDTSGHRVVELRQGPSPPAPNLDRNNNKRTTTTPLVASAASPIVREPSFQDDDEPQQEREFLLSSHFPTANASKRTTTTTPSSMASSKGSTTTTTTPSGGWTFQSPYWTIHSKYVLQITFRPAWQAIPEYTHCQTCGSSSASSPPNHNTNNISQSDEPVMTTTTTATSRLVRTVGSYCCSGTSSSGCGLCGTIRREVDFYCHTWTAADIVQVQLLDSFVVPGMGECQALQLTLSPLVLDDQSEEFGPPPPHYQEAWEAHVERMESSSIRSIVNATDDATTGTTTTAVPVLPTVTFCLPKSQVDPPLLWKVQLPSVGDQVDLALETYSLLDGTLTTSTTTEPTHMYLNGFQSWSFAGSIVRGHDQPQPAMPAVFSRAFGLGGSPPPPATTSFGTMADQTTQQPQPPDDDAAEPNNWEPAYQSDFFTCITSDGETPVEAPPTRLQTAMDQIRSSSRKSVSSSQRRQSSSNTSSPRRRSTRVEEEPFPFQKLDERGGPAAVLGWLAQRQQFGVITADRSLRRVAMHASADGTILPGRTRNAAPLSQTTDWAYVQLLSPHSYDEEPMVHYLHNVAAHNNCRPLQNGSLLTGWCSWYHYYSDISEANLRENFSKLAALRSRVPTNVAVVDDGYMTSWGDWDSLKPGKFDSMAKVARDIDANGMRPGLWLAPWTADKSSQLTRKHPDWIITNDFGAPANSANCGKFFYGLDATNPHVHEHVYESIRRAVQDWKYNVLKIDFLYAACLQGNGKYNLSMSRAQAMHLALDTISRAAGPNVFLIGCGCPIASAIGYVDGMRISADTGPTWYPSFPLPWWDHGTLPCLRSMVRNSISRAPMGHRWWHNDPDCLLLGHSTRLSDLEVASAATVVAMTCGMMLLSDDLTKISPSRTNILTKIFPMTGASAVVLDLHSTNDGLPSLLRLWATDNHKEEFMDSLSPQEQEDSRRPRDFNREATFYARKASFVPSEGDSPPPPPNERKRSCIYAPAGLGSWTIISLSNWSDETAVLYVPPPALLPPPVRGWEDDEADTFLPENNKHRTNSSSLHNNNNNHNHNDDHGYHVLAFWSSRYSWLPPQTTATSTRNHQSSPSSSTDSILSRRLLPHETEIFHMKQVTPDRPQYLGSDLHFSCCREVARFVVVDHEASSSSNTNTSSSRAVHIYLRTTVHRVGHVFVFLPILNTTPVRVTVNGQPGLWIAVGNTPKVADNGSPKLAGRVIRISVTVAQQEQTASAPTSSTSQTNKNNNGHICIQF